MRYSGRGGADGSRFVRFTLALGLTASALAQPDPVAKPPSGPCTILSETARNQEWLDDLIAPTHVSEAEIAIGQRHYENLYACLSDLQALSKLMGRSSPGMLANLKPLVEWRLIFTGSAARTTLPRRTVLDTAARDALVGYLHNERSLVDLETSPEPAVKRLRDAGVPAPKGFVYVKYFADRERLPESLKRAFADEATAGVTLPGGRYVAILKARSGSAAPGGIEERAIPKVLSHELVHAYINARFSATSRIFPRWFQEGVAIYLSGTGGSDNEVRVFPDGSREIRRTGPTMEYRQFGVAFEFLADRLGQKELDGFIATAIANEDAGVLLRRAGAATDEALFAMADRWRFRQGLWKTAYLVAFLLVLGGIGRFIWSRIPDRGPVPVPEPPPLPPQPPPPEMSFEPEELVRYFHTLAGHSHEPSARDLHLARRLLKTHGEEGAMALIRDAVDLIERFGLTLTSFSELGLLRPEVAFFSPSSGEVTPGTPVVLSWLVHRAAEVRIDGRAASATGSWRATPEATTNYTLQAANPFGDVSVTVTVVVADGVGRAAVGGPAE